MPKKMMLRVAISTDAGRNMQKWHINDPRFNIIDAVEATGDSVKYGPFIAQAFNVGDDMQKHINNQHTRFEWAQMFMREDGSMLTIGVFFE